VFLILITTLLSARLCLFIPRAKNPSNSVSRQLLFTLCLVLVPMDQHGQPVRELEIYVSESTSAIQDTPFTNTVWNKVMNYAMNQASGDKNYVGEKFNFPAVQKNMKWVGINILNSYNSANGYTGLSEVKLFLPDVSSGHLNTFT
jgi:hypothetical protein